MVGSDNYSFYGVSESADPRLSWRQLIRGKVQIDTLPGDHLYMLLHPHVQPFAARLRQRMDEAWHSARRTPPPHPPKFPMPPAPAPKPSPPAPTNPASLARRGGCVERSEVGAPGVAFTPGFSKFLTYLIPNQPPYQNQRTTN